MLRTYFLKQGIKIAIEDSVVDQIRSYSQLADCKETGGILIGYYGDNYKTAYINKITGPPSDSRSGFNWFARGVQGLAKLLSTIWKSHQHFYLGEWHYHPYSSPTPSPQDKSQLRKIASDTLFICPEPIMIIAGGNPNINLTLRIFLYIDKDITEAHLSQE